MERTPANLSRMFNSGVKYGEAWDQEGIPGASNLSVMFYFLSWWWVFFVSLYLHSIYPNSRRAMKCSVLYIVSLRQ